MHKQPDFSVRSPYADLQQWSIFFQFWSEPSFLILISDYLSAITKCVDDITRPVRVFSDQFVKAPGGHIHWAPFGAGPARAGRMWADRQGMLIAAMFGSAGWLETRRPNRAAVRTLDMGRRPELNSNHLRFPSPYPPDALFLILN